MAPLVLGPPLQQQLLVLEPVLLLVLELVLLLPVPLLLVLESLLLVAPQ